MTEAGFDGFFFDLDGVVYVGKQPVPHAVEVLNEVSANWPVAFLTNNAGRTPDQIAEHLRGLGVNADANQVIGSAHVGVEVLARVVPAGSKVLLLGADGLRFALEQHGFIPVAKAEEEPVAVIQGFSADTGWKQLAEASWVLANTDIPWVATNMDPTFPHSRGTAPGNGSMAAAIAAAIGRGPDYVAGKPAAAMFETAMERFGVSNPLMIGDRLDTDVLGAKNAGIGSALVLTGGYSREDVRAAEVSQPEAVPDFVWEDLRQLRTLLG